MGRIRLKVSPGGRHFVDREGKPFFWLRDTSWPLFTRYSPTQAEEYLKRRSAQGFTVIHTALIWPTRGAPSPGARPNPEGQLPWLNNDPAAPNEAYFKYIDHLVGFANQQVLVLALLPTVGAFVNDNRIINSSNACQYGRWIGARYRNSPNVIWVNGGDRAAAGFETEYRELARGLREGDQGAHLITFHPCGGRSSSRSKATSTGAAQIRRINYGVGLDEGLSRGVDHKLEEFFPEYFVPHLAGTYALHFFLRSSPPQKIGRMYYN